MEPAPKTKDERKAELLRFLGSGPLRSYSELRRLAGSSQPITELVKDGLIERFALGMYGLPERETTWEVLQSFSARYPGAVICLKTAAAFHGLGTENPDEVWAAFPYEQSIPRKDGLAVRGFRWKEPAMSAGVETYAIGGAQVRMTSPARTVVDFLRMRDRSGEAEMSLQVLASYSGKAADLMKVARQLGVDRTLAHWFEAKTGLGMGR